MSVNLVKMAKTVQRLRDDHRWKMHLKACKKNIAKPIKPLSYEQKREIKEYYSRFGFNSISTAWHEYIYSSTGNFSPTFLPEDFFHGVLENTYNCRNLYSAWEDKAFMPFILDCVRFPETICCNVNGHFFDNNRRMISVATIFDFF